MDQFRVRVGRVVRHGGADVRVIDGGFTDRSTSRALYDSLTDSAASLPGDVGEMVGYVLIGWDAGGWCVVHLENSVISPVRAHMLPVFCAEKLRERLAVAAALDAIKQHQHQSR